MSFRIGGENFDRVPYGDEEHDWGANRQVCHDCGVRNGELHIFGCDAERCLTCGGQVIRCECEFDDELIREKRTEIYYNSTRKTP